MNPQTSSLVSTGASSVASRHEMCSHFTARGRKCRLRALRAGLCFRHAALQVQPAQPVDVDLSADFLVQLDDLQSADQINQFLAKLLILVVQNRISPRRAAVLTYITNQLLHSLVAIKRQLDSEAVLNLDGFPCPDYRPNRNATQTAPETETKAS
jgi:hypothetical protein